MTKVEAEFGGAIQGKVPYQHSDKVIEKRLLFLKNLTGMALTESRTLNPRWSIDFQTMTVSDYGAIYSHRPTNREHMDQPWGANGLANSNVD